MNLKAPCKEMHHRKVERDTNSLTESTGSRKNIINVLVWLANLCSYLCRKLAHGVAQNIEMNHGNVAYRHTPPSSGATR